jgi:valyl-tRNA synthetase
MWNASRLILLNADGSPEPRTERVEDRWILTRLQQAIEAVGQRIDEYDFSHAALEFYEFFWSEFCDWYLEIVKPRLYDGDKDAAANLLFVLEDVLALAHPAMPFVTEEIWGYLPDREKLLVVSDFPSVDRSLIDPEAALAVQTGIQQVRQVRRWRDLVGVPPAAILQARLDGELEFVPRLARLTPAVATESPLATIGGIPLLAGAEIDRDQVESRIAHARDELRSEIDRAERKLDDEGFVSKAPPDVVEAEREKLARYRAELEELG